MNRLQRGFRKVRKRLARSRGVILMYHRVAAADIDPWELCVSPRNFAEHLQVLQSEARPLGLREFARLNREGRLPERAVAITFDDGYADNLYHARPLLETYGIPATVFVAAGYIGKGEEFWWDELARRLFGPGKLPEKLALEFDGKIERWEVGTDSDASRNHSLTTAPPGSRLHLYRSLWQRLLPLADDERRWRLREIARWAGGEGEARADDLPLDRPELEKLADSEAIEIGAHTLTHPFLPARPPAEQRDEIREGKKRLEEMLDRPVTSFSYPFGGYTPETIEGVRAAGFDLACSTVTESCWRQSERWQLPRPGVGDWNGEEFSRQLARWFTDD
ncbi:polysaccharide deacetylase family protein [Pannus brasiliensis CCIBt3594]|uniref:Polysaccharide deacetylase family protein n=1 Tax=Pannus brasiliensis CCIBt3594 TaxID=1427578 RepID=A0AAW9QWV0_9CHRO